AIKDLAATNYDSADVSVLLGRGDGTFRTQERFDATNNPMAVTAGDLNGDGHIDLVVVDSPLSDPLNRLAGLLAPFHGTFLPEKVQILPDTSLFLAVPTLADFDHDGVLDMIVGGGERLQIFKGNGDGSFTFVGGRTGSHQPNDFVVSDFNGDGNLDIL